MQIIDAFLPPGDYFHRAYPKKNIVLHHTVSDSVQSVLSWWAMTPEAVATAFIIDKDGTIYRAFPEYYWAHHLGLKSRLNTRLNQQSIGIELVNEGRCWTSPKDQDLHWFYEKDVRGRPGPIYRGPVVKTGWRGGLWWPAYPNEQVIACCELIRDLVRRYDIAPTIAPENVYNAAAPEKYGIYAHHHVRIDKTDVSPAFPWDVLREYIMPPQT